MPTEVFVRTWSAPEGLRCHERTSSPAGSGAAAVRSAGRPRRQMLSSSSTAFPTASQVASRSLHSSGGGRPTSWTTSKGNWIHRSSPAPYQDDVSMKQRRLPKVLLARLGGWRPSTAAGKGAEPATMPVLFPLKPQFRPGRGAEQELDQRLEALREIFGGEASASPRSSREWTMPARLEELSKPRMQQVPKGLAFRECATPPEALIKKKRKPMHIPMSPKERLAASGGGNQGDLLSDLDDLDRMLARYDSNGTDDASETSSPKRRPQPAAKRSKPSKAAEEVPKTAKAKAKAWTKRSNAPPSPEPLIEESSQEADVGAFSEQEDEELPMDEEPPTDDEVAAQRAVETLHYFDGSPIEAEPDTPADAEHVQSDVTPESELAESEPADSEAAESASAAGSNAGVDAYDAESTGRLSAAGNADAAADAATRDDLAPAASDKVGSEEADSPGRVAGIAPAAGLSSSADDFKRETTGLAESYSGFEEGDSKPATPACLAGQGTTPAPQPDRQVSDEESAAHKAAELDQANEALAEAGAGKQVDTKPSFLRPAFVPAGEYSDDAEAAAIKIQSLHRGRQARKRVSRYRDQDFASNAAAHEDTAGERSGLASASKLPPTVSPQANETLPGQVDEVPRRIPRNVKLPELPLEQRQHVAALQIQTQYRGRLGRRKFAKVKAAKDEVSPSRRTKSKDSKSDDGYSDEGFDED